MGQKWQHLSRVRGALGARPGGMVEKEDPRGEGLLSVEPGKPPSSGLALRVAQSVPVVSESCWEGTPQIQEGESVNKSLQTII